jgi:hypothetical protein
MAFLKIATKSQRGNHTMRITKTIFVWDGNNKIVYDGDKKLSHAGIYLPID